MECSPPDVNGTDTRVMAVELHLHLTRGEDHRLSGTARTADGSEVRSFSGTLELMRVFEELVPIQAATPETAGAGPRSERTPTDTSQPTQE